MQWLWEPYIPFGKITIIQGDPGEGKTTLALRLAAACSTGVPLPGMSVLEPFSVIYQSAEDGMGDTIKPRLMDAGADLDRVLSIVEDKKPLSLLDERIEQAILENSARLMILDPVQGYALDLVRNLSRIKSSSDDPEERKREQDAQRAADNLAVAIGVTVAAASILMEQNDQPIEEQTL